jgi:hypothetical protein
MAKIEKVWFNNERIYLLTDSGETLSRPLEAFPVLKEASEADRNDFKIGRYGDDLRWEKLDEDIHISSFYETVEPNLENEVGRIFRQFPQLNVSEMARYIGINKSLLAKYIYGIKKPSEERMRQIKDALHVIGKELIAV